MTEFETWTYGLNQIKTSKTHLYWNGVYLLLTQLYQI
jgi:hypothetical protein